MIDEVVWVKAPMDSSRSGDFFASLYAGDDPLVVSEGDVLDDRLEPSLFCSEFTVLVPESLVTAKALSSWVSQCASSASSVLLVVAYNKAPLKCVSDFQVTEVDATVKSVGSVKTLVGAAGRTIDPGAVKKVVSAGDKAPNVLVRLITAFDHIAADDVVEFLPVPEEKFYLISSAVMKGDVDRVEELLTSFDEYKVPMMQVLAFVNKQVMAAVACLQASGKDRRGVALSLGISEKSVQFFLRGLPRWSQSQAEMVMWVLGWTDSMAKSNSAVVGDESVRMGIRSITALAA